MAYKAPVRDLSFVLHDVLQVENYGNLLPYADLSRDLIDQIVEEGGKFADEVIAPINRIGDQEGCVIEGDAVTTPKGWKEAYQQMVEAGWPSLGFSTEYGGQGLPTIDRKSTRLNSSHVKISYAVFCLKKKNITS